MSLAVLISILEVDRSGAPEDPAPPLYSKCGPGGTGAGTRVAKARRRSARRAGRRASPGARKPRPSFAPPASSCAPALGAEVGRAFHAPLRSAVTRLIRGTRALHFNVGAAHGVLDRLLALRLFLPDLHFL